MMLTRKSHVLDKLVFGEMYVSPDPGLLVRLDGLIEQYFREQKDPDFYSSSLAYTTRALNRVTRLFKGRTVFGLIQDRLVVEGKLLLCCSHLSVKQVTYELGFEDPAYFSRFFKKMTGYAPLDYRRLCSGTLGGQELRLGDSRI